MRLHQSAHPWLGATPFPPAGARHHISVWRRPASPRAPLQLALPRRARPPAAGRRAALAPGRRRCSCTSGELTRRRDRPQAAARLPSAQVSFFFAADFSSANLARRRQIPRKLRSQLRGKRALRAQATARFLRNLARVCLKISLNLKGGSVYRSQPLAMRIVGSFTPNSAAAERVFLLLKSMFGDEQMSALADMIQAALMLKYNQRMVD